ncbi:MAG: DUF4173 domain-containing protein [Ruminococcus flavefaciens]|nr:DUF4173 domain-containing protein [Ruminococcus flavefaciens]MCM1416660.1 DUF4173 domain-containing protein [bacterium]
MELKDNIYTQRLKENFPFFGIGNLLYSVFYTFCLYKNASGITYPFFVAGTLFYFFFSMQKLGVPYKKNSIFYMVNIVLLGVSNCLTDSAPILFLNKCGIFLLALLLMIHTTYSDNAWNLPKYFGAMAQIFGTALTCIYRPFSDMVSYFDVQKKEKTGKKSYFLPIFAGILITIPILLFMTLLLASADAVFSDILYRIFSNFDFTTAFELLFMAVLVSLCSYAVYAALCMKNVKEEASDSRSFEPITAIIVTAALSVLYLMFSMIQILYLFIGKMKLPEGYTYSSYAREGFFQLLFVCILNLVLVLVCLYFFRENVLLKVLLTIVSGCTFIMILSSALRMLMYIGCYNLTFLRVLVLWALAVIFFLMAGVTVFIYIGKFPLFTYSIAIVTVFYIGLSFAHPDYWIARYNLNETQLDDKNDYDIYDSKNYLSELSADAAPILLDQNKNQYLSQAVFASFASGEYAEKMHGNVRHVEKNHAGQEVGWIYNYYCKIKGLSNRMHVRNFNFSVYRAGKYVEK